MTYYFPLYSSITVDMANNLVIIRKYRFLFLNNVKTKLEFNKIKKAYTEKNKDEGYGTDHRNSFDGFDLIFILKEGQRIVGLEGEIDKNNERIKLNFFLRQFFPGDTDNDEKATITIQLQNLQSNYQQINSEENNNDQDYDKNLLLGNNGVKNENSYKIFEGIEK